jgi:DNA-binding GntR family transcriptional regulator
MILRAPENRFFERLAELASHHSVRIRSLLQATVPSQNVLVIADEHSVLVQPLQARGAALASERLVSHQEHGMERTLSALKQIRVSEA